MQPLLHHINLSKPTSTINVNEVHITANCQLPQLCILAFSAIHRLSFFKPFLHKPGRGSMNASRTLLDKILRVPFVHSCPSISLLEWLQSARYHGLALGAYHISPHSQGPLCTVAEYCSFNCTNVEKHWHSKPGFVKHPFHSNFLALLQKEYANNLSS